MTSGMHLSKSCLALIVGCALAFSLSGAAPTKLKTPAVKVANNATTLEVTNTGSEGWTDATVYLNGTPPDGYRFTVPAPKIGEKIQIPLRNFAKKDGTRFNPSYTKVTVIWVGGGGFEFKKFSGTK
jgi:hypothetical protein